MEFRKLIDTALMLHTVTIFEKNRTIKIVLDARSLIDVLRKDENQIFMLTNLATLPEVVTGEKNMVEFWFSSSVLRYK